MVIVVVLRLSAAAACGGGGGVNNGSNSGSRSLRGAYIRDIVTSRLKWGLSAS